MRSPSAHARALAAGNPDLATALVNAGLEFDSKDPTLVDLRDRVRNARVSAHEKSTQGDGETAASSTGAVAAETPLQALSDEELRARFAAGLAQPAVSLTDARALTAAIDELAKRGAEDPPEMRKQLKIRLAQQIGAIRKSVGHRSRNPLCGKRVRDVSGFSHAEENTDRRSPR